MSRHPIITFLPLPDARANRRPPSIAASIWDFAGPGLLTLLLYVIAVLVFAFYGDGVTQDDFLRRVHDWSFATGEEAMKAIGTLPILDDPNEHPIPVYLDPPGRWCVMLEKTAMFLGLIASRQP